MTDERFEARLSRDLLDFADERVRPVDAHAVAVELIRAGRPSRIRTLVPTRSDRAWLLLVAAALVLLAILSVAVVGRLVLPHGPLGPLAFVRDGGLWAASADGTDQRLLAEQGGDHLDYLYARWSPDGRYLLAVRDLGDINLVPALELFDRDGRRLWSRPLEPGGLPDVSWAPDSRRFVVAEFPTIAATTGELLAPYPGDAVTPVSLAIFRVDGSRTSFSVRASAPPFIRPQDAHIPVLSEPFVRWSPAGDLIAVKALADTCCEERLWMVSSDGSTRRQLVGREARVLPLWFEWQPAGRAIDVLGWNRDQACQNGNLLDGVCVAGFWSIDANGGGLAFTPMTGESGGREPGGSIITSLAPMADGRHVALAWGTVQATSPAFSHTSTRLDVFDSATSTREALASGEWTEGQGTDPTDVVGQCVAGGAAMYWTADGTRLFHLGVAAGDEQGWSIRAVDVRGGPSTTVVSGVTTFDLARR